MKKSQLTEILAIFYFLIATVEISSIIYNVHWLHHIAKSLLLPVLATLYLVETKQLKLKHSPFIIISLFFSWLGDIVLMFEDEIFFMIGLGSFLIAYIIYIFIFVKMSSQEYTDKALITRLLRYNFFIVMIGLAFIVVLYPVLGDMKIPVFIFTIVLSSMAIVALHRYGKTHPASFWLVFFGSFVFIISDGMIAINKFHTPIYLADVWIMTIYVSGQYMIIKGLLAHQEFIKN